MPLPLRGDLTRWCQEIQSGVYVGNVSGRIRERLWQRINENIGQGEATLVYNTNNELGYTFRTTRRDKEVIDADGIPLMRSLVQRSDERRHGFSDAYKFHQAKKFSHRKEYQTDFAVLDLETTGLRPTSNQIISIGAVKCVDGHVASFYRLVKLEKGRTVPVNIARVTKLSDALLNREGVETKEAIIDLQHFVKDLPIVGYNLMFDERFLQAAVIKNNLIQFNSKLIDILPLIKRVNKFFDNYRLSTVLKNYGINNESPHNSLSDARATMELANKLIKNRDLRI